MNLRGNAWKDLFVWTEEVWSLSHYTWCTHVFQMNIRAEKNTGCEGGCGKRMGNIGKDTSMAADDSQKSKKKVIDEARNQGRKVHFASLMDLCHLKYSESAWISKVLRQSLTPRRQCERWFRTIRSIYWTGVIRINSKQSECTGHQFSFQQKWRTFHVPNNRWNSKAVRKRPWIPRILSKTRTTWKEWRSQWRTSWRTRRFSTDRMQRWRWSPESFLVYSRWLHLSSSQWTSSFNSKCRREKHSPFHCNTLM